MLKRALAGVSALALLGGAASAADLATKYPVKAVAPVVPVFSWTGFYIGGNIGWAWADQTLRVSPAYGVTQSSASLGSANGFTGGGQVGYNYQFANNVVLGLEAAVDWADIGNNQSYLVAYGPYAVSAVTGKLNAYGTINARLGYAMDRFMPYITGGVAWGNTDYGTIYGVDTSSTKWGWNIGGGVEYAFTNNWTAKVEYKYIDLEGSSYTLPATFGSISADTNLNVVTVGVNYKF